TDTGSLGYLSTTPRDVRAAAFLLEWGASLAVVARFSEGQLLPEQQAILNDLLTNSKEVNYKGLEVLLAWHSQVDYQGGLALLARKLMEVTGVAALFLVVEMAGKVYVVGRSDSDQLDVNATLAEFGGGGHAKAASATIKGGNYEEILGQLEERLQHYIKPSIFARHIMTSPVKTVSPDTKIEEVAKVMLRYGHTGLPVEAEGKLIGIISRRDVDKAVHHGLSHAPVKGYMSSNIVTVSPDTTLEEMQELMIEHNIGRLPVLDQTSLVGIVTRSDVLSYLHGENVKAKQLLEATGHNQLLQDVEQLLQHNISPAVNNALKAIGTVADKLGYEIFMVGGIVRDMLLGITNEDMDLAVEGDAILLAQELLAQRGGKVTSHEKFGTATWTSPNGLKVDLATARREHYEYPAALPIVERSNLKEDLYRRDFTVNAMAVQLNGDKRGYLIDFFQGYQDLQQRIIRVLYNLSFVEDPTRILRAVRFELRLGFAMDDQTLGLAINSVDKLAAVSEHRIATELKSVFNETNPLAATERFEEIGVWHQLINEEMVTHPKLRAMEELRELLEQAFELRLLEDKDQRWLMYLAALYYGENNWVEELEKYALSKKDNKLINELAEIAGAVKKPITSCVINSSFSKASITSGNQGEISLSCIHAQLHSYSAAAIVFYAAINAVDYSSPSDHDKDLGQRYLNYLVARQNLVNPLSGADLKELGVTPGPIYSSIFMQLEMALLDRKITNRTQALRWVKSNLVANRL
ncbi:MAG: CBS domain-containing protein, partial [Bacillota bacterium]|nr:CBS domain-containing protein [Bacillota bacterium]